MILFENLDPDATTFAVIDTLLYLFQAFISAHIIYRLLPILTKDQADQSLPKTFLTLALTGVGALMLYKYLSPAGLMILHPPLVGIIMVLILKYLMWMSYLRCVIVTLFSAVLFTLFFFLNTRVVNSFLPAERNTLLKQFGTAIELMEEVEVGKDEKFIDKEQLAIMARNLKLQKEAWEFAFMIMENPITSMRSPRNISPGSPCWDFWPRKEKCLPPSNSLNWESFTKTPGWQWNSGRCGQMWI